jgi:hypothetical protein
LIGNVIRRGEARLAPTIRNTFDWGWLAVAVLPLIGILPTIGDGVIKSADAPLHTHRIFAMTLLLEQGEFWPRWVSYFHLGYGYPVFNFYPPGVFYLGGILGLLGISAPVAFTVVAALAWVLGSLGMYALARHFLPGSGAILAAMLWAYAPSRLYEVWHQGSLPQMMAAACVPWIFWGLVLAASKPSRRSALALALPFAGMVLTHQPVTLVTGLFVAPAALILPLWLSRNAQETLLPRLVSVFGGLLLGVGLVSIFLVPMVAELRLVAGSQETRDTIPYLISNFLQPQEIFAQPGPMDLTDMRFELPTTLGLVGGVLSLFGLVALVRRKYYGLAFLLLLATAFMVYMLLEISLPAWRTIPYLAQLRFPARLLRVGVVFVALASGASILLLPKRWQGIGLGAALTITLISALPLVYPNQKFVNWPALSALDEIQMEQTEHNWGTTSYDEFDPIWGARIPLDRAPDPEQYITDPLRIVVRRSDINTLWPRLEKIEELDSTTTRVTVTEEIPLRFHQYYFPGWTVTMNGQPVDYYPDDQYGLITVDVPPGEHTLSLKYTGTPVQYVGGYITLASLLIAGVLYRTGKRVEEIDDVVGARPVLSLRQSIWIIGAVVAFALVNTFYITPNTRWFRYQSPPDAPALMQTPVHAKFGEDFELLGYTLNQTSVAPGQLLNVTLFWLPQRDLELHHRPVVQLVNLSMSQAWAVSEPFFPGGGQFNPYTTQNFASELHSMRVFDFAKPYVGRIMVQMIDTSTDQPLTLPDGSDRVLLEPLIRINAPNPVINPMFDYRLGDGVDLWCASVNQSGDQYNLDLYWHVTTPPGQDLVTFVHGLDSTGDIVEQSDAPPLGADYPSSLWLLGQNLMASHMLPANPAIESIAVGLYTSAGGARLPVTQAGKRVADDRVLLPLEENSCQP